MIHTFKALGCCIAMDVDSGAVHVLDQLSYDLLNCVTPPMAEHCPEDVIETLSQYPREELEECWQELKELAEEKLLFEEEDYINPQWAVVKNTPIKALCLNVAHDCNLRCKYCFASTGGYGSRRAIMSPETAKRAIDFVIEKSGKRHNIEVDFFGGEPLMAMDTVKETIAYARSIEEEKDKNFRFTITTNGMLLNPENTEYINTELKNAVLSLDGRKEVNDNMRPTAGGKGSYDIIVPKFQRFVQQRGDQSYYMRGTFTHDNVDFTNDIFHMADLGFTELSMEPVVSPPGEPWALTQEDLPKLFQQYELLAQEMLKREREGRPITFYHYMLDLEGGPCLHKRMSGCGSGTEYLAVTPWGELFPCHQFVNDPAYSMGDVWKGITNPQLGEKFHRCNVVANPDCRDCWARLYCAGGCAANAYHASGDINGTYTYGCELFKKRIECAIMMKAAQGNGQ